MKKNQAPTNVRAIIMADGKARRWGDHPVPKHLLKVDGEQLLVRTIRLLKENGIRDIRITSHEAAYELPGTRRYEPIGNRLEIDKFFACKPIWNRSGDTLFIYGDVFFTEEAMRSIVSEGTEDFTFYGRYAKSSITGKAWGEIFALRIREHSYFSEACQFIRRGVLNRSVRRGGAWELYRHMCGQGPNSAHRMLGHFFEIDDFTEDFDYPHDFEQFEKRYYPHDSGTVYDVPVTVDPNPPAPASTEAQGS
jgi:hypothetical protein